VILIIDDEPGVCVAFRSVLTASLIPSHSAESLAAARMVMPRYVWAGRILDIFLPDGTGVDFLAELRAQPKYRHTPVAVITADILLENDMHEQIRRLGARLYFGAFNRAGVERVCADLVEQIRLACG
jgi:CheY-like chemotaxis protein